MERLTSGSHGVWLLTLLIDLMLNMLLLWYSSIEDILKICFDGSQLCSFEILMCRHVSISSSVEYQVINTHVNPTIDIGKWALKYASIPSCMFWLVGLSHNGMPKYWHWLGFINFFSVLLPNHKPCLNIIIMPSHDSIVYEVVPVHIGTFSCSEYSIRKYLIMHSSDVNDTGRMLLPKQFLSAWLSISVEYASQWFFSCLLEVFAINILNLLLIWNISDCRMRP